MVRKIEVHYEGWGEHWHLATLAQDARGAILFEYTDEACRRQLELSPLHLKLRPAPAYGGFPQHQMGLPGLVSDALPDGWGLLLMDRIFRRNGLAPARISVLDRLAFIGSSAMGALSFHPAAHDDASIEDIPLHVLARESQVIASGQDSALLSQLALTGGSPHGARPKVLVHIDGDRQRISTQAFEGSQPWMVKFPAQSEHPEVCAIEHMYADCARKCGLDMPATAYFDLGSGLSGFGIQRFDRDAGHRVPIHTFAGLVQADFRLPGAAAYDTLLRATRFLTRDAREVVKAFERAVFNVLFHNRDDHPKNFSYLLTREQRWVMAPAYDLTHSEGPMGRHQMDVMGEDDGISFNAFQALAAQAGLSAQQARHIVERQANVASRFAQDAADQMGTAIRQKTLAAIQQSLNRNITAARPPRARAT